jgi:uncharacterized cupredoxin-like copper-binding protein
MTTLNRYLVVLPLALALVAGIPGARAHTGHQAANAAATQEEAFGRPGDAKLAKRTISIQLTDAMRINPASLAIRQGETVRLHITNDGKLPHELVLGTKAEIDEHAKMMREMPNMVHTDASSVRLESGKSADIVWNFSKAGTFLYACLIPGHWEAGMQGTVTVAALLKR